MQRTELACGTIQRRRPDPGRAAQSDDAPATIWIIWPAQPTITDPKRINVTINAVMTDLGSSVCAACGDHGETTVRIRKTRTPDA
jgi:hypothetical protein